MGLQTEAIYMHSHAGPLYEDLLLVISLLGDALTKGMNCILRDCVVVT